MLTTFMKLAFLFLFLAGILLIWVPNGIDEKIQKIYFLVVKIFITIGLSCGILEILSD